MTEYKTQPKTEYKPNVDNWRYIVENLYHVLSGEKPDKKEREALYAGVDGMIKLYEENPDAFYTLAAVTLLEGAERAELKSNHANVILKYLAQSMVEKSSYAPLLRNINDKGIESKLGGK